MAGKLIAVEVEATPSKQKHPADTNQSGSWQLLGQPVKQPAMKLKSEKGAPLFMAMANFIYMGGSVPGPVSLPPIPAPPLQLKAKKTKILEAGQPVLVEGDTIKDNFGNELAVSDVSGKLSTT